MFHAETSAPSALDLPSVISLSTIETPLTPDGDCVAGYRGTDTEKALDPRKGISEPSAVTSRASQKRCVCLFAFRSRVRLGAVPRHGTVVAILGALPRKCLLMRLGGPKRQGRPGPVPLSSLVRRRGTHPVVANLSVRSPGRPVQHVPPLRMLCCM